MRVDLRGWLILLALAPVLFLLLTDDARRPQLAALLLATLALALRRRWLRLGRGRRPARRRSSPARRPIPAKTRQQIYARDGHTCLYCGRRRGSAILLHLDHLYPYALGGTDDPENLVTACADCNLTKGVTVFRTDRDLARFAAQRQAWAADLARRDRRLLPGWVRLLLFAGLLLAIASFALLR